MPWSGAHGKLMAMCQGGPASARMSLTSILHKAGFDIVVMRSQMVHVILLGCPCHKAGLLFVPGACAWVGVGGWEALQYVCKRDVYT